MADINDLDDVGDFLAPPRHPDDIRKECNKLSDKFMDFMMEEMYDFVELDAARFAYKVGVTAGFMLGTTSMENIDSLFYTLKQGFDNGVEDAEEVLEEAEDE